MGDMPSCNPERPLISVECSVAATELPKTERYLSRIQATLSPTPLNPKPFSLNPKPLTPFEVSMLRVLPPTAVRNRSLWLRKWLGMGRGGGGDGEGGRGGGARGLKRVSPDVCGKSSYGACAFQAG